MSTTATCERCFVCDKFRQIADYYFGWCIKNAKHNPMNPYDDGYRYTHGSNWCGEFKAKGADDVTTSDTGN